MALDTTSPFLRALSEEFMRQEPTSAFYSIFPQAGGLNPFSQFLRSRFPVYQNQYLAAAAQDPTLQLPDFLRRLNPQREFEGLAPSQRGLDNSRYAPPVRWARPFGF